MKPLLVMVGFVAGLACSPSMAQPHTACQQADIATCPSFFTNQCASDTTFQKQNTSACMKILAGHALDKPSCANLEKNQCPTSASIEKCASISDSLDRFFCEQGRSNCPRSIRTIKSGYDKVLGEYDNALSVYQPILDLNLKTVVDKEKLCSYSLEQLGKFKTLAEQDDQRLKQFDGELNRLKACGDTVQAYLRSGKPPDIEDQLWQTIRTDQEDDLKEVAKRKGALESKKDRLKLAPSQIGQLTIPYRLACPETPQTIPTKPSQTEKKL